MKKSLIIIPVIYLLSGCQTIMMGALGIKQPLIQSNYAIQKYATKHFTGYTLFRVDSLAMSSLLHQVYKPNWEPGFRPVQFICFAPDGKIITQWASCEGNLNRTLSTFPPKSEFPGDSSKSFSGITENVHPILKSSPTLALNKTHYTYIVYWAIWTGRQSTELVDELEEYVKKNGGDKNDILLVNTDIYKS